MKLYYAPNSRAVRVAWLLEELGLDYQVEKFELGSPRMRAPEYRGIHPMGRVPVLEDGDIRIFESGAIVEWVLAVHGEGRMVPEIGTQDFADYLQWLHYAEGMIMPPINTIVVETVLLPPDRRNEGNVNRATKLLNQMLMAVEARMEGRQFLAGGDLTGADIMFGHACIAASRFGGDLSDKPNLAAYVERLQARPAFQRADAL